MGMEVEEGVEKEERFAVMHLKHGKAAVRKEMVKEQMKRFIKSAWLQGEEFVCRVTG